MNGTGHKTSYFLMVSVVTAVFIIMALVLKDAHVMLGAAILPCFYVYSRTVVKKSESESKAPKVEQDKVIVLPMMKETVQSQAVQSAAVESKAGESDLKIDGQPLNSDKPPMHITVRK